MERHDPSELRVMDSDDKSIGYVPVMQSDEPLKAAASSIVDPIEVDCLPDCPVNGGYYTFRRIPRSEVTRDNHDLHKYPAKFIPQFPEWALRFSRIATGGRVLDPFCGSGTTLIEAGLKGCHAVGIDISPLAVLISQAKTSILVAVGWPDALFVIRRIVSDAVAQAPLIEQALKSNVGRECYGMHRTWSNWFRESELSELLAIRDAIHLSKIEELKPILFASLSSIVKSASFLNEDQIKVRYEHGKVLVNVFDAFAKNAEKSVKEQFKLSCKLNKSNASFEIKLGSASNLTVVDHSIDCVITSPPYINAVDYTMNQKYNIFVLGMLKPHQFNAHRREYIGMTERAVTSNDVKEIKTLQSPAVDSYIKQLWSFGDSVSKNRSYILYNYFYGMLQTFKETFRSITRDGSACFVVGTSNRIRGLHIPTDDLLISLAADAGLRVRLKFYHVMANRSSMRLTRGKTGGEIPTETVIVFERAY